MTGIQWVVVFDIGSRKQIIFSVSQGFSLIDKDVKYAKFLCSKFNNLIQWNCEYEWEPS